MEHDDWSAIVAQTEHSHYNNIEVVARALSVALIGDDVDWKQHLTNARRFIDEINRTIPTIEI